VDVPEREKLVEECRNEDDGRQDGRLRRQPGEAVDNFASHLEQSINEKEETLYKTTCHR